MQAAKLNGVTLHYQVIGADEAKPTIVFANSLGTDQRIWRDVIVRLVGEAGIITYDMRGHGLSDLGQPPHTMEDHVGDLAALIDHLGGRPSIVCGLSVGGLVAQGLALSRPDLVQGLILCDTGMKIGDEALWLPRIETVEASGMGAIVEGTMERWFTRAFHDEHPDELALYANMLRRQPAEGYTGTARAILNADYRDRASTISVPTLCIVGDDDRATPPSLVRDLAQAIPEARFEVIKGAGHLPCVEQPAVMADMICAFLSLMGEAAGTG